MNVIEIDHLTYCYPGASNPTLKDINLKIERGDFLAIVGNNGCGKSTFCKTLNGIIPRFISGDFEGTVSVCGMDTQKYEIGDLAKKVGYVYQDFENQIIRPTVLDDASYACLNYAMGDYKKRGMEALEKCGLSGREDDYIWQLSGGQTHLLALAGAVSLEPDILILDEPIAQLDPMHADRIYSVLKELNEKYGKTIIVIEHHTEYIADFCKHVMLMKNGSVEWVLDTDEALQRVDELQSCNIFPPQVTIAADAMKKQGRFSLTLRLPTTVEQGKAVFVPISEKKREKEQTREKNQTADMFNNVSVSYRSVKGEPKTVFKDLNLKISKGDKLALIGSNGAGKSTLMKMLIGLLKPTSGDVELFGHSIKKVKAESLSRKISMVYQNPEDMFIKDSIAADVAYAMKVRNIQDADIKTDRLLKRFRLAELKDRDGRLLSGGQMRRASLAIGTALDPKILLLDEPTANLDIATRKEIMTMLDDLKNTTETVVIATHDMQLVCEWADRIVVLCQGEVIADGTRDEIFENDAVTKTAGIRPPEIFTMAKELDKKAVCYTVDDFLRQFDGKR